MANSRHTVDDGPVGTAASSHVDVPNDRDPTWGLAQVIRPLAPSWYMNCRPRKPNAAVGITGVPRASAT
jgi:hypothetical protein